MKNTLKAIGLNPKSALRKRERQTVGRPSKSDGMSLFQRAALLVISQDTPQRRIIE